MRGIAFVLLIIAYLAAANVLYVRASRFLKDQNGSIMRHQIWDASLYSIEGQGPRLAVVRFLIFGGIALILALLLLSR